MRNKLMNRLSSGLLAFGVGVFLAQAAAPTSPQGTITGRAFLDIGGGVTVADLTGNAKFPNSPDVVQYLPYFEWDPTGDINGPPDGYWADNYGTQIVGYFYPPETGEYYFFIASDDGGALYLSTDSSPANKKLIAQETGWSSARAYDQPGGAGSTVEEKASWSFTGTEWPTKDPGTGLAIITLQANQPYYIEALSKEGGGGDNLSVAVLDPGGWINSAYPIPGQYLSSIDKNSGPVSILTQPQTQTVNEGDDVTFSVLVDGTPPYAYQWRRNGLDIGGATGASYSIKRVSRTENGAVFSVFIAGAQGTATSANAVLTVNTDIVPPAVAYVSPVWIDTLKVVFNEPVDAATAETASNYGLSGGLTISSAKLLGAQGTANDHIVMLATGQQPENTALTLTVSNVKDLWGNVTPADSPTEFTSALFAHGWATYERWLNANGGPTDIDAFAAAIADGSIRFPDDTLTMTQMSGPWGAADYYEGRVRAFFVPETAGNYVFFFGSDDRGLLYLSTDASPANKKLIAREDQWSGQYQFTISWGNSTLSSKRSDQFVGTEWPGGSTINLQANARHYLELLWDEDGGGDGADATVIKQGDPLPPNDANGMYLKGNVIGTYVDPAAEIAFTKQPTDQVGVLPSAGIEMIAENFNANNGGFTVENTTPAPPGPWIYQAGSGAWVAEGSEDACTGPYNSRLSSPAYTLGQDGAVTLSFSHRYSFEGDLWDAGLVRISVNGGEFTPVPAEDFTANGYAEGAIIGNGIALGLRGFNGDSPGYNEGQFITSKAVLGTFKQNDSIVIQFVGAWDDCATGKHPSWVLDSFKLEMLPMIIQDFGLGNGGYTVANTTPPPPGPWVYQSAAGAWVADGSEDECTGPYHSLLNSPAYTVPQTDEVTLRFTHRYSFESDLWDGGQVRISVNGGDFTPVPAENFTANGYAPGVIQGTGILNGQPAFNGDSPGYADGDMLTSSAILGSFNQNDSIVVQFAGVWDECASGSHPSWVIQKVELAFGKAAQASTFTAEVSATLHGNPATVYYQWQRNDGAGFVDIPNANGPSLRIYPTAADFDALFRLVAMTPGKTVTSNEVKLVTGVVQPPEIAISLDNGQVMIEYTGTLESAAEVTGPFEEVPGAPNPYLVPNPTGNLFFRSVK